MSRITLHPEHGVNPSLEVCFWCGEAMGVALLGRNGGKEAPREICTGYAPCDKCKETMTQGAALFEANTFPNWDDQPALAGGYPTGRWSVVKREAVSTIFTDPAAAQILEAGKAFLEPKVYAPLFDEAHKATE